MIEFEREYISSDHFHYLPGRFRVGVPVLQGNQAQARKLARQLERIAGIVSGEVNPVTGRVLVVYNPRQVNPRFLLTFISQSVARFAPPPTGIQSRAVRDIRRAPPSSAQTRKMPDQPQSVPRRSLEPQQVLQLAGAPAPTGLAKATAIGRLKIFGPNELVDKDHKSLWELLGEPLKGFMTKLLVGAAAVSFFVGETMDAAVIVTIVILQAGLETVQGYRAEKSLAALKELSAPLAQTIREGQIVKIPARELVPGDLIQLEAGDRVPADAWLLKSNNLMTDEASLTGESIPVIKVSAIQPQLNRHAPGKANMIFAGTSVTSGKALAMVTATGMNTEMGHIAAMLETVRHEDTFLHKQMESLGKKTTGLVLMAIGAIIITGLWRRRPLLKLLSTGVSLAVSAIPEGLPAVVTVGLAFGVQRMAHRNAVVRRLSAVETLGGVTAICTDKTGTLTANEMTVKQIYAGGEFFDVSGEGYRPDGQFFRNGRRIDPGKYPALKQSLLIGALCNNAALQRKKSGYWNVLGDPTEGALLAIAAKGGIRPDSLNSRFCRERELVFDAERRMMSVICRDSEAHSVIYTKGAPETLLPRCSGILKGDTEAPLEPELRRRILEAARIMAGQTLRILALAVKTLAKEDSSEAVEDNLIFAGLVGMADPPRRGVPEAIRQCRAAGIKVIMITGDHQSTAAAIAGKLGLLNQGRLLTGQMLEKLSDQKLGEMVNDIAVYARTSPTQKLRIVKALQKRGHVVAMTGDGINDAPAVKEADIGIAMGRSGTDVTREAAGITLSDDNFTTIVAGVEEGRTVAANIGKATRYVLPGNWGQVLAVFLASVSGFSAPLVPSQILWINLVTEGFPAMALAADPPHPDCMKQAPYRPETMLFSGSTTRRIIQKAFLSGLTTYGVYAGGLTAFHWNQTRAQTMAFSHLVISRVLNIFDSRPYHDGKIKNPYIFPAASLSTAMLLLTLYVPWLNPIFKTIPLGLSDWGLLGISAGIAGRLDSLLRQKRPVKRMNLMNRRSPDLPHRIFHTPDLHQHPDPRIAIISQSKPDAFSPQ